MPVVDLVVNEEKLRALLAEQGETETLDYKRMCDLSRDADLVELAKDVGAMEVDGGFIVVGADDHGNPTGDCTPEQAKLFDEATLRAKLRKYLPAPLDVRSGVHTLDGKTLVVVAIGPNPEGFAIFSQDGAYTVTPASGNPKTTITYRKGDVFVRHGSASERWEQADIVRIKRRLVEREKEAWRREFADTVRVQVGQAAQEIARGPAEALSWELDEQTFLAVIVEQLRQKDEIPLRLLFERAPVDARRLVDTPEHLDELGTLLDRLVCVAALALRLDEKRLFGETVGTIGNVYDLGYEIEAAVGPAARTNAARLWLMIIERVYALGALAVRRGDWPAVRYLALKRPTPVRPGSWSTAPWLRHGLTMAARSGLFQAEEGGRQISLSLLSLAKKHAEREECLRNGLQPEDEWILDSLCQFDALSALAAIADAHNLMPHLFYTSFARFWSHRTEPAIVKLLTDPVMRAAIFPGTDDELAQALRRLDAAAQSEGFNYPGWDGFEDPVIVAFLRDHPAGH